jgi:hypothetical protein
LAGLGYMLATPLSPASFRKRHRLQKARQRCGDGHLLAQQNRSDHCCKAHPIGLLTPLHQPAGTKTGQHGVKRQSRAMALCPRLALPSPHGVLCEVLDGIAELIHAATPPSPLQDMKVCLGRRWASGRSARSRNHARKPKTLQNCNQNAFSEPNKLNCLHARAGTALAAR